MPAPIIKARAWSTAHRSQSPLQEVPVMRLAHLTIQWRITLLSGLCLLAVVGALVGTSVYQNQQSAKLLKEQSSHLLGQAAVERLQAQAAAHGQQVERFFNETALYSEGFAQQVLQLRD